METYIQHCLEGDVLSAYNFLKGLQIKTGEQQELIVKYEETFFTQNPTFSIDSNDPWIRGVVSTYYTYFVSVLTKKYKNDEAEERLYKSLLEYVSGNPKDINEVEGEIELTFKSKGYYFLGGYTLPFKGPYIWRKQEKREYEVELPLSKQNLKIYLMDDFLMISWLHFATFGKRSTGGWAKPDGLYCVRSRYGDTLEDDMFQVSFLKHEAQHVDDYEKYPHLAPWELEYRAKLVEIIYGDSDKLLEKFINEAKNNPDFPHLFASYNIKQQFACRDSLSIQDFAIEKYKEHTFLLNENKVRSEKDGGN